MGSLQNMNALVTAGAQGIGMAISKELILQGADVAVHYYTSEDGADEVIAFAEEHSCRAEKLQGDLTSPHDAEQVVSQSCAFLNGLDILINNAGSLVERRSLEGIDPDYWRKVIDINMHSMIMVTQRAVKAMSENAAGSIVNLASLAGRKGGHAGSMVYAAAKGAVLAWTRALAEDVADTGIRVNAVAPGLILGSKFHDIHTTDESKQKTIASLPVGRAGTCEDVARAVVFLASEYDGFIHGATLDINGGAYYC